MPRPRIKICGVTRVEDVLAAADAGADAIGLNFHPPSPRFVTARQAAELIDVLPPFVEPVGVVVNRRLADLAFEVRQIEGLTTVQWHGENPELDVPAPLRMIPAFAVRGRETLEVIRRYLVDRRTMGRLPPAVLLDAHVPGRHGGTGQTAPWDLLADFDPGVPLILAGGLTPRNVAEAVRRVRPYAVDVASGVESAPGMKDAELMRRFIGEACGG